MELGATESTSRRVRDAALERFEIGRAAWPQVTLELASFERYFVRHATRRDVPGPEYASDMYLACACAEGSAAAIAAFELACAGDMARAAASIDSSPAFVDEVRQTARERLLVR